MDAKPAFLLDTNICIYLLEGGSKTSVRRVEACDRGDLAVSAISYAEVMIGAREKDSASRAKAFFDQMVVVPFDAVAGDRYGRLPFKRSNFDRLIAAHALSLQLTLVTNNERDFTDVPGLKVENWAK